VAGQLTFSVLGPLEVRVGDEAVPLGGKPKAILACLLLRRGEPVGTDELIDDLWGEDPPPSARASLQMHISKIRKTLAAAGAPEVLRTRGSDYVLDVDPDALDLTRFERLVNEARTALTDGDPARARDTLERALALWRGAPLAGIDAPGISPGELLVLEERRSDAMVLRIECDLATGHHREVVPELEALRAAMPLDERLTELTALALYRAGRTADALATIAHLRRALSEELGMDAGPSILHVEGAIVSGDPSLRADTPADEPASDAHEGRRTLTAIVCRPGTPEDDPETRRAAVARLGEAAASTIEAMGGTTLDTPVGGIATVFGLRTVNEDDALRALRTADGFRGVDPTLRIGVSTGEVLVGEAAGERTLLTTDPVDLARELARRAQPGEVLMDHGTARLAGLAMAEPAEVLLLEDGRAPAAAFRLTTLLAGAPGRRRLSGPLVGRRVEIGALRDAFERTRRESAPRLVTILGPAGIGKTRLVEEFLAGLDGGHHASVGRCLPFGRDITMWPVAEIVRDLAGIGEADPARRVRGRIAAVLRGQDDAEFLSEQVGAVLGLPGLRPAPDELFWAIRRFLEAAARARPLVAVFDDLQWADDMLLDLVEYVAATAREAPLLVVTTARTELSERRASWGGRGDTATLRLVPLPHDEAGGMLSGLLGGAALADDVHRRLLDTAEGNPLFLEELLAILIDDGHLRVHAGRWEPTADLGVVPLPPSIRALMEARLDRLADPERAVIEAAAVIGNEFSAQNLNDLRPDDDAERIDAALEALIHRDLIHLERVSRPHGRVYRFHHILLRDVAYRGIPKQIRARDHERFGDALELAAGDRMAEVEEIVAYHLEAAYELWNELGSEPDRARSLGARAATRLSTAGRRAFARDDLGAAASLLQRSLRCLPADDARRLDLFLLLAVATFNLGRFEEARGHVAEGLRLAERRGDERMRWRLLLEQERFGVYHRPEEHGPERLLQMADEALATLDALGDAGGAARAHRLRGEALMRSGHQEAALDAFRESRLLFELADEGSERVEDPILAALHGPLPLDRFIEDAERILEQPSRQLPDALARLGLAYAMAGRADDARSALARALDRLREVGGEFRLGDGYVHLGYALLFGHDADGAAEALAAAVLGLERIDERSMRSTALALQAEAQFRLGRIDESERASLESEALASDDDPASQMAWRQVRAKVLAVHGRTEEAVRLGRAAVEIADATDFLAMAATVHADLAAVLVVAGDPEGADAERERAADLFARKNIAPGAAAAWLGQALERTPVGAEAADTAPS
jgi:DNA-binding SARP family transcriptional activator/tetratricopeptide (TPR) repeat protein